MGVEVLSHESLWISMQLSAGYGKGNRLCAIVSTKVSPLVFICKYGCLYLPEVPVNSRTHKIPNFKIALVAYKDSTTCLLDYIFLST